MWSGFVDEEKEKPVFDWFKDKPVSNNLNPAFVYTIAAGEGMARYFTGEYGEKQAKADAQDKAFWVDGFEYLGLDRFVEDLPRLRAAKLLPASFKEGVNFKKDTHKSEIGETVISADFPSFADGVAALVASLRLRNELVKKDAADAKLQITEADQEAFWTYAYFCMGEGAGKKIMAEAKGNLHNFKPTAGSNVANAICQRIAAGESWSSFHCLKSEFAS